jgi:hypothetical protein
MSGTLKIVAALSLLIGYGFGQRQPKTPATAMRPPSHWRVASKKSARDGIVTTTLVTDSLNFGGAGSLMIRCGGRKAELYVGLGDLAQPGLGGGHNVRIDSPKQRRRAV